MKNKNLSEKVKKLVDKNNKVCITNHCKYNVNGKCFEREKEWNICKELLNEK